MKVHTFLSIFYILSFVEHVILRKKGVFDLIDLFFLKGQ